MSLVNVAHTRYLKSISCGGVPCRDGHEVWQLVTPPEANLQLSHYTGPTQPPGSFLTEPFVKPPVKITLTFQEPFALWGIVVGPTVGRHRLRTLTTTVTTSVRQRRPAPYHAAKGSASRLPQASGFTPQVVSLGTLVIPEVKEDTMNGLQSQRVGFRRTRALPGERTQFSDLVFPDTDIQWHAFPREPRGLAHVTTVELTITGVYGSSVVSLASLQVLGVPRTILHRQKSLHTLPVVNDDPLSAGSIEQDVPTEFLDPITTDVMREPVILPSGHRCDISTNILRLLYTSTLLPRLYTPCWVGKAHFNAVPTPNDPFTGLPLAWTDVKADHSLRNQIQTWKNEQNAKTVLSTGREVDMNGNDPATPRTIAHDDQS
ncbi:RING finger protein 37 [Dispira parvispora]|uniref:RING finger protein 37 n=1 Tax=Dispira parvispora TaxID=1520584 RepID=A0A9W8APV9_9FUNG|nr:RING finger protein 37 [Dispira parvispora]